METLVTHQNTNRVSFLGHTAGGVEENGSQRSSRSTPAKQARSPPRWSKRTASFDPLSVIEEGSDAIAQRCRHLDPFSRIRR